MKASQLALLAKAMGPALRDAIEAATAPLKKQIAEQEQRIAELEAAVTCAKGVR